MAEMGSCCLYLSFTMKIAGYSLACAILQALHLSSVRKKASESHHRRYERETNSTVFPRLCESSFQIARLCIVALSDI